MGRQAGTVSLVHGLPSPESCRTETRPEVRSVTQHSSCSVSQGRGSLDGKVSPLLGQSFLSSSTVQPSFHRPQSRRRVFPVRSHRLIPVRTHTSWTPPTHGDTLSCPSPRPLDPASPTLRHVYHGDRGWWGPIHCFPDWVGHDSPRPRSGPNKVVGFVVVSRDPPVVPPSSLNPRTLHR